MNNDFGSTGATRTVLAEYFRAQAAWRDRVAEDYPNDSRNHQSARALEHVANVVESMSVEDEVFQTVALLQCDLDVMVTGEEAGRLAGRYGFDGPFPSADDAERFIRAWVNLYAHEAIKTQLDVGEDMENVRELGRQVLGPDELEAIVDQAI